MYMMACNRRSWSEARSPCENEIKNRDSKIGKKNRLKNQRMNLSRQGVNLCKIPWVWGESFINQRGLLHKEPGH